MFPTDQSETAVRQLAVEDGLALMALSDKRSALPTLHQWSSSQRVTISVVSDISPAVRSIPGTAEAPDPSGQLTVRLGGDLGENHSPQGSPMVAGGTVVGLVGSNGSNERWEALGAAAMQRLLEAQTASDSADVSAQVVWPTFSERSRRALTFAVETLGDAREDPVRVRTAALLGALRASALSGMSPTTGDVVKLVLSRQEDRPDAERMIAAAGSAAGLNPPGSPDPRLLTVEALAASPVGSLVDQAVDIQRRTGTTSVHLRHILATGVDPAVPGVVLAELGVTMEEVREVWRESIRRTRPRESQEGWDDVLRDSRNPRSYHPSTAVTSDVATTQDALQYELYADAIAKFILDEQTTAPLTIGIKAPWGAGKTSLMRMIRSKLDPYADRRPAGASSRGDEQARLTNGEVVRQTKRPPDHAAEAFAIDALNDGAQRTTIWFNAWKYQSGEQVWAGLAHAIISQVEARMSDGEREHFWASLNIRRVDVGAVRRRIYAAFLERIAGYAVALPFMLMSLLFVALAKPVAALGGAAVVGGAVLADFARRWKSFANESVGASTPQLVRDPGYEGQLGFLHLVHEDLQRVLSLVASRERPLVVFVDDLDRCSYGTVAQVIEALNTFLAGDFDCCVFVIAMEPDLVAAQIHVAYRDLFDHIEERGDAGAANLGWRFLEKMVQLPVALPPPQDEQLARYVGSLVGNVAEIAATLDDDDEVVLEAQDHIERMRGDDRSLAGVASALDDAKASDPHSERPAALREAVYQRAARVLYASEFNDRRSEVQALVARHAQDLNRNPREIKRFLNVFRFYAYVAFWRRSAGIDAPDLDGAAKLAMLAVRSPQLLSALGANDLFRELETAADNDTEWSEAVSRAPSRVQTQLADAADVRSIIGREPRVAGRAAGFL